MTIPPELDFFRRRKLVDALLACRCLQMPSSRNQLLADLPAEIAHRIDRQPNDRQDVDAVVLACLQFVGGVEKLLEIVYWGESDSLSAQRLNTVVLEISAPAALSPLLDEVRRQLSGSLDAAVVAQCYRRSYGASAWADDTATTSAYEAFLRLLEFGAAAAVQFLDRLATEAARPALRQTAMQVAAALGIAVPHRRRAAVHLLIQLAPTPPTAETVGMQAWSWHAEEGCRMLEVPERPCVFSAVGLIVQGLVSEIEEQYETTGITVELIVPRRFFCRNLAGWQVKVRDIESELLFHYPLVLRWLPRFIDRRHRLRWRDKWQALPQPPAAVTPDWLECADECTPKDMVKRFDAASAGLCLALGFVPPAEPDERDLLTAALSAGTPIILWSHCAEQPIARGVFEQLLADGSPTELPQRVQTLRQQAVNQPPAHPGHHLTLLYDDADRVPPTLPMRAPG